ncbi:MAG: NAD(P)-binding domain-containing protein [Candidatus Omnitrophica bacterium]|nr:NAD(P)-binding domain-containing protein [Candidatus Omnitrophota bacterium]
MPDKDLIEISVERVIPAEKWRVVRLLTKVWDFPSFVPSVKEVSVIQKSHNKIKTRWRIQVDKIPISWIEEDELALKDNAIYFNAVEGDLQEFKGEWRFRTHEGGTLVSVKVNLRVGLPVIEEFAQAYVKNMLTSNFAAILEALEQRLISKKYASYKQGDTKKIAGFGILGHFYNFNHLARCLKMINPNYKLPSREFLHGLFSITPSFKMYEMEKFVSKTKDTTHGCFIVCTFIPDMMAQDMYAVYAKVVRACKLAEKHGVGIVTLGGFTSMVGERLGHRIEEDVDIPITTGNTYTAVLALEAVEKAVQLFGKELKDVKIAVVGGTGDIGSACSRILAEKSRQVTITGRTKSNLRLLSGELKRKRAAKIEATTDNRKAVKDADVVIAAANSSASILDAAWFKPGAVICDLAYPKNISYAPISRKDIFVFSGGLASIPTPIDMGIDLGVPSPDISYGCFSEVIILALEHRFENFSYGRGNISVEKMQEIKKLAVKHGFELAPFYWADKLIGTQEIEEIKKAAKNAGSATGFFKLSL